MNSMGVCRSDTPIEQNVKKILKKISAVELLEKTPSTSKKTLKIYDAHLPMSPSEAWTCAFDLAERTLRDAHGVGR